MGVGVALDLVGEGLPARAVFLGEGPEVVVLVGEGGGGGGAISGVDVGVESVGPAPSGAELSGTSPYSFVTGASRTIW